MLGGPAPWWSLLLLALAASVPLHVHGQWTVLGYILGDNDLVSHYRGKLTATMRNGCVQGHRAWGPGQLGKCASAAA